MGAIGDRTLHDGSENVTTIRAPMGGELPSTGYVKITPGSALCRGLTGFSHATTAAQRAAPTARGTKRSCIAGFDIVASISRSCHAPRA